MNKSEDFLTTVLSSILVMLFILYLSAYNSNNQKNINSRGLFQNTNSVQQKAIIEKE